MISVSGFRSDGAKLALLHDRGFGDMSLLLLDLASGEARVVGVAEQFPERALGERRRTLLALTDLGGSDFMRLCRLDPASGDVAVVYEAPDATWRRGRIVVRCRPAGDGRERSRLCRAARRTDRRRAPDGDRTAARRRRRSGLVARRQQPGVQCRGADRTAIALAVARRRGAAVWQPEPH